ncbi:MAG: LLM class flavin-dependent oxidoreductase [Candidatus Limnocylindrales bacterium]
MERERVMERFGRRVGLGVAARGEVADVVRWALTARDRGLDSLWIHDSYFERDAVSYGSAVAAALGEAAAGDGFRLALGAVIPNTRHPVVLAMTGSALDEMAPGRIIMGLGTGLPLRLKQMGLPYTPDAAIEGVSRAMDQMRLLWAGERLPSATEGLPPIQPMFAPPHRIPLFIAAYRREFVTLAGQKADGYLARPAESIASLKGILERLSSAAAAAGRDPAQVERAGYLLTLVDDTRREALNRAKREPFVIYMMSVLGDVSMRRAGFELDLRDRIAAAWRAEDFHEAGKLIPDELLDAFMLCGTRDDVAAGATRFHDEAGLDLPLLQPVVQETDQVVAILEAATLYGTGRVGQGTRRVATTLAADRALGPLGRARRAVGATWEVLRPFAYTASIVPIAAAGALAATDGRFDWPLFLLALAGGILLHSGTNVVNEVYDVRKGVDTITSPRASHAVLKGRLSERGALRLAYGAFAIAIAIGVVLVTVRGWPIVALGLVGLAAGYFYTAPPFAFKYRAMGPPVVFLMFGPLMLEGAYFAITGAWSVTALVLSVPVGLLVTAIVQGNEWRDISEDARAGIVTLSSMLGKDAAHLGYLTLILGAFLTLGLGVAVGWLPAPTMLAVLALPFLAQVLHSADLGASGQVRAIAMIDLETARLHLVFGAFLVTGVLLSGWRP